jgi:type VI protein secretion system component VasK
MRRAGGADGDAERIQLGPLTTTRRGARWIRGVLVAITGLVLFALVLVVTASLLLDKDFYEQSLQHANAYDRFYTQVLADKQFNATTKRLTGNLPIDKSPTSPRRSRTPIS